MKLVPSFFQGRTLRSTLVRFSFWVGPLSLLFCGSLLVDRYESRSFVCRRPSSSRTLPQFSSLLFLHSFVVSFFSLPFRWVFSPFPYNPFRTIFFHPPDFFFPLFVDESPRFPGILTFSLNFSTSCRARRFCLLVSFLNGQAPIWRERFHSSVFPTDPPLKWPVLRLPIGRSLSIPRQWHFFFALLPFPLDCLSIFFGPSSAPPRAYIKAAPEVAPNS